MAKITNTEIAIVGAGVAGCFASLLAARAGYKVKVYDSLREIGEAKCAEGVWTDWLHKVGIKPSSAWIRTILKSTVVHFKSNSYAGQEFVIPTGDYLVLDRKRFQTALLDDAQNYGTEVRFGERIKDIRQLQNKHIIGAWGFKCIPPFRQQPLALGHQWTLINPDQVKV